MRHALPCVLFQHLDGTRLQQRAHGVIPRDALALAVVVHAALAFALLAPVQEQSGTNHIFSSPNLRWVDKIVCPTPISGVRPEIISDDRGHAEKLRNSLRADAPVVGRLVK